MKLSQTAESAPSGYLNKMYAKNKFIVQSAIIKIIYYVTSQIIHKAFW